MGTFLFECYINILTDTYIDNLLTIAFFICFALFVIFFHFLLCWLYRIRTTSD